MLEKLFKNSLWASGFNGALDMLYFALSITAVAIGLFFLGKVGKH